MGAADASTHLAELLLVENCLAARGAGNQIGAAGGHFCGMDGLACSGVVG